MKTSFYGCLLVFLVFLTGCGSKFVPLSGKVTFSDDGSPLTAGYVYLDNGKTLARGKINEDGTYIVGTMKSNDGIEPGHYTAYIQHAEIPDPSGKRNPDFPELVEMVVIVDGKFVSPQTSGLEVSVDKSTKSYDIVVDRNPLLKPAQ